MRVPWDTLDDKVNRRAYELALERIAELEAEVSRLKVVMYDVAHKAGTLGSGHEGWMRGRFMSISNALNMAIGRGQSSHGDQFDSAGNIVKPDPLNSI